jgi:hypothetical protein
LGKAEANAETETHHVSISPKEDRGGTKGTVGDDTGREEESGVDLRSLLRVCGGLSCFQHPALRAI